MTVLVKVVPSGLLYAKVTVLSEIKGLIAPETVTVLPSVSSDVEEVQDILVGILDTVKEKIELAALSCSASPSHEAFTFHEPLRSGVKVYE